MANDTQTTVVDSTGVAAAGPDDARVAQGVAAGGDGQAVLHSRNGGATLIGGGRVAANHLKGDTVGPVSDRQAGILPMGGVRITDDMVRRGLEFCRTSGRHLDVDAPLMRDLLEVTLRG